MSWGAFQKILFSADAETVHHFMLKMISKSPDALLEALSQSPNEAEKHDHSVFGLRFRNQLGLAAGFDKNAEIVSKLPSLGFGFVEIGTVTPRPQAGNPKPRLFRVKQEKSLFNCLGFNGAGAAQVSKNLELQRQSLPLDFRVGLNIGKNKDTPLERAREDYVLAVQPFRDLVDYVTVNVSSPNTEGLRSLQSPEFLIPIISDLKNLLLKWRPSPPLLVKFAPEFSGSQLKNCMAELENNSLDAYVATNTLLGSHQERVGGWSGEKVTELSRERLTEIRSYTEKPIISVGGINSVQEAKRRLSLGANLIQIYSAWVYEGPRFPGRIVRGLV